MKYSSLDIIGKILYNYVIKLANLRTMRDKNSFVDLYY